MLPLLPYHLIRWPISISLLTDIPVGISILYHFGSVLAILGLNAIPTLTEFPRIDWRFGPLLLNHYWNLVSLGSLGSSVVKDILWLWCGWQRRGRWCFYLLFFWLKFPLLVALHLLEPRRKTSVRELTLELFHYL